jgi:putative phage-type endonuclease
MNAELQRTVDWYQRRVGKVTASRVADVMARTKTGYSATRAAYMADLVVEALTGQPKRDGYQSPAMLRGIELEPIGREFYQIKTGNMIDLIDFVDHPTIADAGASPDGLVGDDTVVEFKAPETHTHLEYIESRVVPSKYFAQIQFQLACTGRSKGEFVSFDTRVPANLQMLIVPVPRDDKYIAEMEKEVVKFLEERDAKVKFLREVSL